MGRQRPGEGEISPTWIAGHKYEGLTSVADTVVGRVEWLIPGLIPAGVVTLIEGRKGRGKSTVLVAIAAAMSGGPKVPGWSPVAPALVAWVGSEDRWDTTVCRRIRAAAANPMLVQHMEVPVQGGRPRRPTIPDDEDWVRARLRESHAKLWIIDPIDAIKSGRLNLSVPQDSNTLMDSLTRIAWEWGGSILCSRNLRKDSSGDPLDHGLGGIGLANRARAIIRLDKHPHTAATFVMHGIACNEGEPCPPQIYRFAGDQGEAKTIEWVGKCDLSTETLVTGQGDPADEEEVRDADRVLYHCLRDGPRPCTEVVDVARSAAVSEPQLKRARARLGVKAVQPSGEGRNYWMWHPPTSWPPHLASPGGGVPVAPSPGSGGSAPEDSGPIKTASRPRGRRVRGVGETTPPDAPDTLEEVTSADP